MYKFNKNRTQFQWITLSNGLKFKVKPMSLFSNAFPQLSENDTNKQLEITYQMFNAVVDAWEGIYDEKEVPLDCTTENKKLLFDFDQALVQEVVNKSFELRGQVVTNEEAENLKNLQAGSSSDQ